MAGVLLQPSLLFIDIFIDIFVDIRSYSALAEPIHEII